MTRELLIGAGSDHRKKIVTAGDRVWHGLVTLDINPDHHPDLVWDLTELPLPFADDEFDEIHAYEVLEHTGQQGDYKFFFRQWEDFWRILKPGGRFYCTCPALKSLWLWGDPGHTRIISQQSLTFLNQDAYDKQVGVTPMSDYRFCYGADFELVFSEETSTEDLFGFVLEAVKPSRIKRI